VFEPAKSSGPLRHLKKKRARFTDANLDESVDGDVDVSAVERRWKGQSEMTFAPGTQSTSGSVFKNPLLYSSFALGLVALVVGWILFSRWQENKQIDERRAEALSEKKKQNDRAALDQFGGKELDIQSFYASPGAVHRGESVQLCYGVANAKTVKLEPQSNPVWPSYSRCVDVKPAKTTTYTLTVADASGNTKTQTVDVRVE
jgi:hypothetical protein